MQDKGIAAQFVHTSTPSFEMFQKVQGLIGRAKANVIKHLESLEEYDCSEQEQLAYYSLEKDVLDQPNVELWIDNGKDASRRLTLGKILKTTGINRIPV